MSDSIFAAALAAAALALAPAAHAQDQGAAPAATDGGTPAPVPDAPAPAPTPTPDAPHDAAAPAAAPPAAAPPAVTPSEPAAPAAAPHDAAAPPAAPHEPAAETHEGEHHDAAGHEAAHEGEHEGAAHEGGHEGAAHDGAAHEGGHEGAGHESGHDAHGGHHRGPFELRLSLETPVFQHSSTADFTGSTNFTETFELGFSAMLSYILIPHTLTIDFEVTESELFSSKTEDAPKRSGTTLRLGAGYRLFHDEPLYVAALTTYHLEPDYFSFGARLGVGVALPITHVWQYFAEVDLDLPFASTAAGPSAFQTQVFVFSTGVLYHLP